MIISLDSGLAPSRVLIITGTLLSDEQRRMIGDKFKKVIEIASPRNIDEIFVVANDVTDYILGGPEYIDAYGLSRMPNLRRIALLGTGTPSFIDEEAARLRKITVLNTPHINADTVAEFSLGVLIINAASAIASADGVRKGTSWLQTPWKTLSDSRIGIVGLGHIGQALAHKLTALGVRDIAYASRMRKPQLEQQYGVNFMPLRAMVGECSVVSMHVSYSSETHHLFDESLFSACRPDLRLHCFSNPRTIDPVAAKRALESNQISHIYMDGYYREWTRNTGQATDVEGLLALPYTRFTATSHVAAQSTSAIDKQLWLALSQLIDNYPIYHDDQH